MDFNNVLLYSLSTAAQVWAALLVFQVLLVRDQKAAIIRETDELWVLAKYWWGGLIQKLRDKNPDSPGTRLDTLGLDEETIHGAETNRECFKKIMKENFERKIVKKNGIVTTLKFNAVGDGRNPEELQNILDPIAKRLSELEKLKPSPEKAFFMGLGAIIANMAMLLALGPLRGISSAEFLIAAAAFLNLVIVGLFTFQILKSLKHD